MRCLATAFAVVIVAATLTFAPAAGAKPECTRISPTTTQCQTRGHTQITTSPPAMNDTGWWPYGGFVVGFPW